MNIKKIAFRKNQFLFYISFFDINIKILKIKMLNNYLTSNYKGNSALFGSQSTSNLSALHKKCKYFYLL